MAKPLRTDDPAPQNMQFSHFGVLNDGQQSKGSLFTSLTVNVALAIIVCILGAAAKKTIEHHRLTELTMSPLPKQPPPEPPKPKFIPKPLPQPPVAKLEPPKIKLPEVKLPDPPKIPEVKMVKMPVIDTPAPPKLVQPPPAPKVVNLAQAQPASVPNNSAHPSAVSLGQANNPIAPSNRPATSAINLGQSGLAGMPPGSGQGAHATSVNLGSGSANSQNMNGRDNAANAVKGVKLGVTGGTGPLNSPTRVAGPVNLGQATPPPMPKPSAPTQSARSAPKVLFKPKPEYTAEARNLRIEGTVTVRLRVSSTGAVQVLGVVSDLGHGLGDSAIRAIQATRFQPATDAAGNPVDWEGIVNVAFQLAG
jgi:periplasmic protein TonB